MLVVLMAFNLLLSLAQVALQMNVMTVIGIVINAFLLYSVIKGNESVRRALIVLSWIGLILNGIALAIAVPAITLMLGTTIGIITFVGAAIGIARCAYTIWVLNAPEVQTWMYKRSMGLDPDAPL
ncbi:MAG: hypothetical protein JNK04_05740 [Myxococcales bacterium]|nr:hypothetical protein [Myxococcales bacterium]